MKESFGLRRIWSVSTAILTLPTAASSAFYKQVAFNER